MGLITINHEEFAQLHDAKVLLRAHGEPPETYAIARTNNIEIIDATCPVVLRLQKRIKQEYDNVPASQDTQIVIYGKNGHAEVLGLVGAGVAEVSLNVANSVRKAAPSRSRKKSKSSRTARKPAASSRR